MTDAAEKESEGRSKSSDGDLPEIIIYGGGGQGKTVIDLVRSLRTFCVAGIIDDTLQTGDQVMGVSVLGGSRILPDLYRKGIRFAVNAVGGIGNVQARLNIFEILQNAGFSFPTIIHPSTVIEPSALLDPGLQVLAQTYIGSECRIGFGTLINAGVVVSHDCVVGRCVNLSPGVLLAGGVIIQDFAQIGMGATINMKISIGQGARVGNGATVKADVPPGGRVYAGTIWPARP